MSISDKCTSAIEQAGALYPNDEMKRRHFLEERLLAIATMSEQIDRMRDQYTHELERRLNTLPHRVITWIFGI